MVSFVLRRGGGAFIWFLSFCVQVLFILPFAWVATVALSSILYALADVDRDRKPFWSIWWDYFSHVVFFRR